MSPKPGSTPADLALASDGSDVARRPRTSPSRVSPREEQQTHTRRNRRAGLAATLLAVAALLAGIVGSAPAAHAAPLPAGEHLWVTDPSQTTIDAVLVGGGLNQVAAFGNSPGGSPFLVADPGLIVVPTRSGGAVFHAFSDGSPLDIASAPGYAAGYSQAVASADEAFLARADGSAIDVFGLGDGFFRRSLPVPGADAILWMSPPRPSDSLLVVNYHPQDAPVNSLVTVDASSGALGAASPSDFIVGGGGSWSADGQTLFFASEGDGTTPGGIGVLDVAAASATVTSVGAGLSAQSLAPSADGTSFFVATVDDVQNGALLTVSAATLSVTATASTGTVNATGQLGVARSGVVFLAGTDTQTGQGVIGRVDSASGAFTTTPQATVPFGVVAIDSVPTEVIADTAEPIGSGQSTRAGTAFPQEVGVRVLAGGVPVEGFDVILQVDSGDITLPGGSTSIAGRTDANGEFSVRVVAGDTAGSAGIRVLGRGLPSLVIPLTMTAAPAASPSISPTATPTPTSAPAASPSAAPLARTGGEAPVLAAVLGAVLLAVGGAIAAVSTVRRRRTRRDG